MLLINKINKINLKLKKIFQVKKVERICNLLKNTRFGINNITEEESTLSKLSCQFKKQ